MGALVAANIVGWCETRLHGQVMLAIPGIVYLAEECKAHGNFTQRS